MRSVQVRTMTLHRLSLLVTNTLAWGCAGWGDGGTQQAAARLFWGQPRDVRKTLPTKFCWWSVPARKSPQGLVS